MRLLLLLPLLACTKNTTVSPAADTNPRDIEALTDNWSLSVQAVGSNGTPCRIQMYNGYASWRCGTLQYTQFNGVMDTELAERVRGLDWIQVAKISPAPIDGLPHTVYGFKRGTTNVEFEADDGSRSAALKDVTLYFDKIIAGQQANPGTPVISPHPAHSHQPPEPEAPGGGELELEPTTQRSTGEPVEVFVHNKGDTAWRLPLPEGSGCSQFTWQVQASSPAGTWRQIHTQSCDAWFEATVKEIAPGAKETVTLDPQQRNWHQQGDAEGTALPDGTYVLTIGPDNLTGGLVVQRD